MTSPIRFDANRPYSVGKLRQICDGHYNAASRIHILGQLDMLVLALNIFYEQSYQRLAFMSLL